MIHPMFGWMGPWMDVGLLTLDHPTHVRTPQTHTQVSALLEAEVREHTKQLAGAKLALGQLK